MTKHSMQNELQFDWLNLLQLKMWSKGVCVVTRPNTIQALPTMNAAAPPTSSGPLGCLGGHTPSLSVAPADAGSRPGWLHTFAAPSASGQANTKRIPTYLSSPLPSSLLPSRLHVTHLLSGHPLWALVLQEQPQDRVHQGGNVGLQFIAHGNHYLFHQYNDGVL